MLHSRLSYLHKAPLFFLRLPSSFLPFPSSFKVFYLMHNAIRFTTLRLQLEHSLLLHSQLSYLHKAFSFAHFPPILKSLSLYKFSILCTTLLDLLLCGYNWEEKKKGTTCTRIAQIVFITRKNTDLHPKQQQRQVLRPPSLRCKNLLLGDVYQYHLTYNQTTQSSSSNARYSDLSLRCINLLLGAVYQYHLTYNAIRFTT